MPRARNIKPGFFKNEDIVELEMETRLLFIGLWTLADREGRLEDRPKKIKMELFPCDNVDIDACISELVRYGFALRYEVNNTKYIQILKFAKHQKPHHQEKASEIPPPQLSREGANLSGDCEANPSDSLIADSLIADSQKKEMSEKTPSPEFDWQSAFAEFWERYPRGEGKKTAMAKFKTKCTSDVVFAEIMQGLANQIPLCRDLKFFPHATTWLNGERWLDEIKTGGGKESVVQQFVAMGGSR